MKSVMSKHPTLTMAVILVATLGFQYTQASADIKSFKQSLEQDLVISTNSYGIAERVTVIEPYLQCLKRKGLADSIRAVTNEPDMACAVDTITNSNVINLVDSGDEFSQRTLYQWLSAKKFSGKTVDACKDVSNQISCSDLERYIDISLDQN